MTSQSDRIGENLRAARKAADLTQQDVAERAHVSVGTVARYEQGKTANPRDDEFERIAAAVGRTTDQLRGVLDVAPGDAGPSDGFLAELARRYGPENAEFVEAVARQIESFPPKEATFVRNLLMGMIHWARTPWRNSPDGPEDIGNLTHSGASPRPFY